MIVKVGDIFWVDEKDLDDLDPSEPECWYDFGAWLVLSVTPTTSGSWLLMSNSTGTKRYIPSIVWKAWMHIPLEL